MDPKTPSPPSPSASPPQLPKDLICYGILPRLPVRPLARFAAVCKAWRDLILRDAAFAAIQAQSPSRASTALARFNDGRIEVLTPNASVAPPDPSLSFLTAGGRYTQLKLCACTAGLLCLTAVHGETQRCVVCVVNPATGRSNVVRHWYPRGVVGLAYDPAARGRGYHVVVAVMSDETCRFVRFSSEQAAGAGAGAGAWYQWRAPRDEVELAPSEALRPMAEYAGGRVHWLTSRGHVVWHDVASELSGKLRLPPSPSGGHLVDGNTSIAAWRGRVRLVRASSAGLGVWELASYGGGAGARWDVVHWRSWSAVPGVVAPERCFLWSVVPAGMVAGGEEAVGLALRCAHTRVVGGAAKRKRSPRGRPLSSPWWDEQEVDGAMATSWKPRKLSTPSMQRRGEPEPVHHETETRTGATLTATTHVEDDQVWRRALVRYETRTGATAEAVVLTGAQVHDYFGTVFCYHSSLAALPLPDLNLNQDA